MEKIYQKNSNECVLVDVLSRLDERKIRTMDDLMAPENTDLYEELWLAMKNFVNCVVLKSKTRKLKNGQSGKGNAERVRELFREKNRVSPLPRKAEVMSLSALRISRPVSSWKRKIFFLESTYSSISLWISRWLGARLVIMAR